jgi:hypothetical protein
VIQRTENGFGGNLVRMLRSGEIHTRVVDVKQVEAGQPQE